MQGWLEKCAILDKRMRLLKIRNRLQWNTVEEYLQNRSLWSDHQQEWKNGRE